MVWNLSDSLHEQKTPFNEKAMASSDVAVFATGVCFAHNLVSQGLA
jgi:hypothetical protein